MRAWVEQRRSHGEKPPSADEVKDAVEQTPGGKAANDAVATPPDDPAALNTLDKRPA